MIRWRCTRCGTRQWFWVGSCKQCAKRFATETTSIAGLMRKRLSEPTPEQMAQESERLRRMLLLACEEVGDKELARRLIDG